MNTTPFRVAAVLLLISTSGCQKMKWQAELDAVDADCNSTAKRMVKQIEDGDFRGAKGQLQHIENRLRDASSTASYLGVEYPIQKFPRYQNIAADAVAKNWDGLVRLAAKDAAKRSELQLFAIYLNSAGLNERLAGDPKLAAAEEAEAEPVEVTAAVWLKPGNDMTVTELRQFGKVLQASLEKRMPGKTFNIAHGPVKPGNVISKLSAEVTLDQTQAFYDDQQTGKFAGVSLLDERFAKVTVAQPQSSFTATYRNPRAKEMYGTKQDLYGQVAEQWSKDVALADTAVAEQIAEQLQKRLPKR